MSLLSKVWFVTGNASGLRRSIAEVRLLNLMAIVVTFSTPVIYSFAADTPLLLEPHNLIVDHSLPKEEADTQIIAARRYDSFWNTGDENTSTHIAGAEFCRQNIAGWATPGNCRTAGSLEADAPCDAGPPLRN